MYEYIKGKYEGLSKGYIIVENNNIGYKIFTSGTTIAQMPIIGEDVKLYVEQIVRQDFIGLYGFLTMDELNMFNMLLNVNGVGAKASLSLLSIANIETLKYSIVNEDDKTLTRAPGIGKKTAQRIILELKDKVKKLDEFDENIQIKLLDESSNISNAEEAAEALMALGYTQKEADKVLKKVDKSDTIENIIKESLKLLMN
ncbi:Holliday junction branch migration protein RuvA [Oceanirhabdus sp. W0125-5]|uniref:Holliday junction branch migration protein RuvA n=1 Tax=Oceanirhabdus sp. W0125-5 TaxID=2999116 RepID=UPI0022F2C381|nr:Holliday junction branch migration protein RuvA [Oceanirhabdus sp. W0125-5]WBW99525.1 Holliday junction branch migration protein RuvA [Oceanirhabdus sp. W0125-5]